MSDLEEFQRRVDQYFQCGQRNEPGGRIILDMMRALRAQSGQATDAEVMRAQGGVIAHLRAENEQLGLQREGLLCRVAELRTLLRAVVQEADRSTRAFDEARAALAEQGKEP